MLLISAQLIDSHKQYYRVNKRKMEALKDHSNLGQLNTLGKYATKGPFGGILAKSIELPEI